MEVTRLESELSRRNGSGQALVAPLVVLRSWLHTDQTSWEVLVAGPRGIWLGTMHIPWFGYSDSTGAQEGHPWPV